MRACREHPPGRGEGGRQENGKKTRGEGGGDEERGRWTATRQADRKEKACKEIGRPMSIKEIAERQLTESVWSKQKRSECSKE